VNADVVLVLIPMGVPLKYRKHPCFQASGCKK
jgi:hypothetical protein